LTEQHILCRNGIRQRRASLAAARMVRWMELLVMINKS
jgi:hypothetical protein